MNQPLDTAKKTLDEAKRRIKARRKLFSDTMGDDRFIYLNEQKLANGKAENLGKLNFAGQNLTDKSVDSICDVIRQAPRLREVRIGRNKFSQEGVSRIFEAMENHPTLENISVGNMELGEKGASALAHLLQNSPALKAVSAENTQMTDEALAEVITAAGKCTSLRELLIPGSEPGKASIAATAQCLENNPDITHISIAPIDWEAGKKLARSFPPIQHRNLLVLSPFSDGIRKMTDTNVENARTIGKLLCEENLEELDYKQLAYMTNRLPSAFGLLESQHDEGAALQEASLNLRELLKKMPEMPEKTSGIKGFFQLNEHGYAPLDNPFLWEHADASERLANLSVTQEDLTCRTGKGATLLESLAHGMPTAETVKMLNSQGVRLGSNELLDREGKPNAVYAALMERHDLAPLFHLDNWRGKSRQELSSVTAPLSDHQRSQLPLNSLSQQMMRLSPNQSRGR